MEKWIDSFLEERRKKGLLRELAEVELEKDGFLLRDGRRYVNFSSNDYLGLASHPDIVSAFRCPDCGVPARSSSRLMTGTGRSHLLLEEMTARFKGKESSLLFNTGYQANVGVISSIVSRKDAVFTDKFVHASVIDGALLSGAKLFRFRHNDVHHLEELLSTERANYRRALVVTETVFSMDGDIAPLRKIAALKKKHDFLFMADEAHATGVFGEKGSGLLEETGTTESCDIAMGTFGKALGGFGAYVAASEKICRYLVNSARSFIYSTALPEPVVRADIAAIYLVAKESERRAVLLENARFLREKLSGRISTGCSASQIIPLIIGRDAETMKKSGLLREKGYWVTPVRPPTVPEGTSRIRISVTYHHARDVLQKFAEDLLEIS